MLSLQTRAAPRRDDWGGRGPFEAWASPPLRTYLRTLYVVQFQARKSSTYSHGSLEGVGGLKTNEAYHSKADAMLISEM